MSGTSSRWARLQRELARDTLTDRLADYDAAVRALHSRVATRREPLCTCGDPLTRHHPRTTECLRPGCPCRQWEPVRPGPTPPTEGNQQQ